MHEAALPNNGIQAPAGEHTRAWHTARTLARRA